MTVYIDIQWFVHGSDSNGQFWFQRVAHDHSRLCLWDDSQKANHPKNHTLNHSEQRAVHSFSILEGGAFLGTVNEVEIFFITIIVVNVESCSGTNTKP